MNKSKYAYQEKVLAIDGIEKFHEMWYFKCFFYVVVCHNIH